MVLETYETTPTISLQGKNVTDCDNSCIIDFHHEEIRESWHRCFQKGVNQYDGVSHLILDTLAFKNLMSECKDLISSAKPVMSNLYNYIRGSGFILMLSDENGYLIDVFGDHNTMERASRVNLLPGYRWNEKESGTNGIGTALALKKPVQISGKEHYCRKLRVWTCSAAPIFNHETQIVGTMQISGPAQKAHPHTIGLVVAAVNAIGAKLANKKNNSKLSAINNYLDSLLQTISDAAMIIDKTGMVRKINLGMLQLFGTDITNSTIRDIWGEGVSLGKMLAEGKFQKNVKRVLETAKGRVSSKVTIVPVKTETGQQTDTMVIMTPLKRNREQISEPGCLQTKFGFGSIIATDSPLKAAICKAKKASFNTSHVLIEGESGTGKEIFAQAIHHHGPRRSGPFIAVNCASLPNNLVVSELFGYSEGSFTGALRKGKPGKFEMATGGTLFLDEIGDMPICQQGTLLRVLQEKKITRLGGTKPIPVDTRIICATNRDLKVEVKEGRFRQDLYYRLNVVQISLPPLRNRGNDLLLLLDHFLNKISTRLDVEIQDVQPEVKKCLALYNWPGNIRELENTVEKLIHETDDGCIKFEHLPKEIRSHTADFDSKTLSNAAKRNAPGKNIKSLLGEEERRIIMHLLQQHKGNVSQISRELGVSRNTVYRKLACYGITKDYKFQ
jgi:transcriptional regulator of acetoin/glycerol metabolism